MGKLKQYFLNVAKWIDIGCNVLFFGGSPREYVSSRIGRNTDLPGWRGKICRFAERLLDKIFGPGHCKEASCEPTKAAPPCTEARGA